MNEQEQLLHPLDRFYTELNLPLPPVERIPADDLPRPFRDLLDHDRDMTSTLERFHGERIIIRPIARREDGGSYFRVVALLLEDSERAVEFGAIRIHLDCLPERARREVVSAHAPLGSILRIHDVAFHSCPQAFVRVESDSYMNDALGLGESASLFGRRNVLLTPNGSVLADILEILPPV